MKLAMQILGERPHPNLLPRGEGTTSPPSLPRGRDGHASASEGTGMVHLGGVG